MATIQQSSLNAQMSFAFKRMDEFGDLHHFMNSPEGKGLSFLAGLGLCVLRSWGCMIAVSPTGFPFYVEALAEGYRCCSRRHKTPECPRFQGSRPDGETLLERLRNDDKIKDLACQLAARDAGLSKAEK